MEPGTQYAATFYARAGDVFAGPVTAALVPETESGAVAHAATAPPPGGRSQGSAAAR